MWIINKITNSVQKYNLHNINLPASVNNEEHVNDSQKTRIKRNLHEAKSGFKDSLHSINRKLKTKKLIAKLKKYAAEYWQDNHWSKTKLSSNATSQLCTEEILQLHYAQLSSNQSFIRANISSTPNESDAQHKTSFLLDEGIPENTISSMKTQECLTCLIEEYQFSSECFEKIHECLTHKALVKKYNDSLKLLDIKCFHESVLSSHTTRAENTLNLVNVRNLFLSEYLSLRDVLHDSCFYLICKNQKSPSTFRRSLVYSVKKKFISENGIIKLRKRHHRCTNWKKISTLQKAKSLKIVKLNRVNLMENETRKRIIVLASAVNEYNFLWSSKEVLLFNRLHPNFFAGAQKTVPVLAKLHKIKANNSIPKFCSLYKISYIQTSNTKDNLNEVHVLKIQPFIPKMYNVIIPTLEMITYEDTNVCYKRRAKYKPESFQTIVKCIQLNAFESCPVYLTKVYNLHPKSSVKTAYEFKTESLTKNVADMYKKNPIRVIKYRESAMLKTKIKENEINQIKGDTCMKTIDLMKNPVFEETGRRCFPVTTQNQFSVNNTTICTKNNDKYIFNGDMVILHIGNIKKSNKGIKFNNRKENKSLSANSNNNNISNDYEEFGRKKFPSKMHKQANKASKVLKNLISRDKKKKNIHKIGEKHVICKWINENISDEYSKTCPNENNNDHRNAMSQRRQQNVKLPCGCKVKLKTFKMGMQQVFGKDPGNPTRAVLNHHYGRILRELRRKQLIQEHEYVDLMKIREHERQKYRDKLIKKRRKETKERVKQSLGKTYVVERSKYSDDSSSSSRSAFEKKTTAEMRLRYYEEVRERQRAKIKREGNQLPSRYVTTPYQRHKGRFPNDPHRELKRRVDEKLKAKFDLDSQSTISQTSFGSFSENEMYKEPKTGTKLYREALKAADDRYNLRDRQKLKSQRVNARNLNDDDERSMGGIEDLSASESFLTAGNFKKELITATPDGNDEYASLRYSSKVFDGKPGSNLELQRSQSEKPNTQKRAINKDGFLKENYDQDAQSATSAIEKQNEKKYDAIKMDGNEKECTKIDEGSHTLRKDAKSKRQVTSDELSVGSKTVIEIPMPTKEDREKLKPSTDANRQIIRERKSTMLSKFNIRKKSINLVVDANKDDTNAKPFMTSLTKRFFGPKSSFLSERSDTESTDDELRLKDVESHPNKRFNAITENLADDNALKIRDDEQRECGKKRCPKGKQDDQKSKNLEKPENEHKLAQTISDMLVRLFHKFPKGRKDSYEVDTLKTNFDRYVELSKRGIDKSLEAFKRTSIYEMENRIIDETAMAADEYNELDFTGKLFKVRTKVVEDESEMTKASLSRFVYEDDDIFPVNSKLKNFKKGIKTLIKEIKHDCSEDEITAAHDTIRLVQLYDRDNIFEQQTSVPLGREYLIAKSMKNHWLLPGDKIPRKGLMSTESENKSNVHYEKLDEINFESIEESMKYLSYVDGLSATNTSTLNYVNAKDALCMFLGQEQSKDIHDERNELLNLPIFPLQLPILVVANDVMHIKEKINHTPDLKIHQNYSIKRSHSEEPLDYESHIHQQASNHSRREVCFDGSSADSPPCQCMLHDPFCCKINKDEPQCKCAGHDGEDTTCRLKLCECKLFNEIEKKINDTRNFDHLQNIQNVKLEIQSESSKTSTIDKIKGCNTNSILLKHHTCVKRALKMIKPLETSKIFKSEQVINKYPGKYHNSGKTHHNGEVSVHKSIIKSIECANTDRCLTKLNDPSKAISHLQTNSNLKDKANHEVAADAKINSQDQLRCKSSKFVKHSATKLNTHNNIEEATITKVQNRSNKVDALPAMKKRTSQNCKRKESCQQISISSINRCLPKISIKSSRRICKIDISNSKTKSSFSLT